MNCLDGQSIWIKLGGGSSTDLSHISIANMDSDPEKEIIVKQLVERDYKDYVGVYVFNIDGSDVPGWPIYEEALGSTPHHIVADLDNDGSNEVIFSFVTRDSNGDNIGKIQVYSQDGTKIAQEEIFKERIGGIIAQDINNDSIKEIIATEIYEKIDIYDNELNFLSSTDKLYVNFLPLTLSLQHGGKGVITQLDTGIAINEYYPTNLPLIDTKAMQFWSRMGPVTVEIPGGIGLFATSDTPVPSELVDYSYQGKTSPRIDLYMWDLVGASVDESDWKTYNYDNQRSGCYMCQDVPLVRPQSKVVNDGTIDVTDNLLIKIQKQDVDWVDYVTAYNDMVTIPANGLLKLDIGEDNLGNQVFAGFNNLDVTVDEVGDYRVYVQFKDNSASWEFSVIEEQPNASVSVATLKDEYVVGEQIGLTDPPDNEVSGQNTITGNVIIQPSSLDIYNTIPKNSNIENVNQLNNIVSTNYLADSMGNLREVAPKQLENEQVLQEINTDDVVDEMLLHKGYIVEFEDKPIEEKRVELESKAQANEEYVENAAPYNPIKVYKQLFSVMPEETAGELEEYARDLERKNDRVKDRIKEKLDEQSKLTGNVIGTSELKVENEFTNVINGISLDISEEQANEIKKVSGVKEVHPNLAVKANLMDSIPLIGADDLWQLDKDGNDCTTSGNPCLTGEGVTIAIIDTGIDYTHADLGGCFGSGCKVIAGYDFVNDNANPMDDAGHGTHCAGIAAGNGVLDGVAPDAQLYAYKVLNENGEGWWDDIIAAIEKSVDLNQNNISCEDENDYVDVISLSLGGYGNPDDLISTAIDNAALCTVPVIAAGNSGPSKGTVGSPGTARKAITVGATYKKDYEGESWDTDPVEDQLTSFSSKGPVHWVDEDGIETYLMKPDIVAPGAIICSARYDSIYPVGEHPYYYPCLDEEHLQLAGTSMSAPMVAGAAALVKQMNPGWTPDEIKYSLMRNAIDLDKLQSEQGAGRLNLGIIDQKPPIVRLHELKMKMPFEISGEIIIDDFVSYSLYIKKLYWQEWTEITFSNAIPQDGLLAIYDIGFLEDDDYLIKLEVTDAFGNVYTDEGEFKLKKFDFLFPKEQTVLNNKDVYPIVIKNNIPGLEIDGYDIKIAEIESEWASPENETDLGITLVEEGDKIGEWDTSFYSNGLYQLIVKINYKGSILSFTNKIFLDEKLRSGWPRPIQDTSGSWGSLSVALAFLDQPTIYDINNDGIEEIIVAYGEGVGGEKVYAIEPDGSNLAGFPVTLPGRTIQRGPLVADTDGDGYGEIFVVGEHIDESIQYNEWSRALYRIEHDGSFIASRDQDVNPIYSDDLNNDGYLEIFGPDYGNADTIYLFNTDLEYFNENWPVKLSDYGVDTTWGDIENGTPHVSPMPYLFTLDVNNDGDKEIVSHVVNGYWLEEPQWFTFIPTDTSFYAFDLNGNLVNGWPKSYDIPLVCLKKADFDEDGSFEILCFTNKFEPEKQIVKIYSFSPDGSLEKRFEEEFSDTNESRFEFLSLSIGDIDGERNVILHARELYRSSPTWWSSRGSLVIFVDKFGNKREVKTLGGNFWNEGFYSVGKVTSSNNTEFGVGLRTGIRDGVGDSIRWQGNTGYFSDTDGNLFRTYMGSYQLGDGKIISDLDRDGNNEIIGVEWSGDIYVWNSEGSGLGDEWNEIYYDARHSNCYKCPPLFERPQSKVVNDGTIDVTDNLLIKIQKQEVDWVDSVTVYNDIVTIPANGLLKLDIGKDSLGNQVFAGFNNMDVSIDGVGDYRVFVQFKDQSASWEFDVLEEEKTCKDSDNGLNYYIKGDCSLSSGQSGGGVSDYCIDKNTLKECYCEDNNLQPMEYDCQQGCQDGVCIHPYILQFVNSLDLRRVEEAHDCEFAEIGLDMGDSDCSIYMGQYTSNEVVEEPIEETPEEPIEEIISQLVEEVPIEEPIEETPEESEPSVSNEFAAIVEVHPNIIENQEFLDGMQAFIENSPDIVFEEEEYNGNYFYILEMEQVMGVLWYSGDKIVYVVGTANTDSLEELAVAYLQEYPSGLKFVQCSDCGEGLFNICDEEECYSLGDCMYKGNCVDVPYNFGETLRMEIENRINQDNLFSSIGYGSKTKLLAKINNERTYAYDIYKEDAVNVTSSKYNPEQWEYDEDIAVKYLHYTSLIKMMDDPSCARFKQGMGGKDFFLLPSKFIKPGFNIECTQEFQDKYCAAISECATRDELYGIDCCYKTNLDCYHNYTKVSLGACDESIDICDEGYTHTGCEERDVWGIIIRKDYCESAYQTGCLENAQCKKPYKAVHVEYCHEIHYPEILIEENIGEYNYLRSAKEDIQMGEFQINLTGYYAFYGKKDDNDYQSIVFDFKNKEDMALFMQDEVIEEGFEKREVEGNIIYALDYNYSKVVVWANTNKVIAVVAENRRTEPIEKTNAIKIVGNVVGRITAEELLVDFPWPIISAYLSRYSSDIIGEECTDTDGGINYYEKGTVYAKPYEEVGLTDYCQGIGGNEVTEYYCEDGTWVQEMYLCPNGCEDGACINFKLKPSGTDQVRLYFADNNLNPVFIPLFYSDILNIKFGDQNDDLVVKEGINITKNDYVVVTADGDDGSYALRYKGADKVAPGEQAVVKFDELGTGQRIEVLYDPVNGADLKLGGNVFKVRAAAVGHIDDFDVLMDLNSDAFIDGEYVGIVDFGQAELSLYGFADFRIKYSGTDQIKLEFKNNDGEETAIPLYYSNNGKLKLGDSNDDLILQEGYAINKNDYLVVTAKGKGSYALRYKGADKVAPREQAVVKFDELGTGQRIEVLYDPVNGANLRLGGNVFKVESASNHIYDDFDILVDMNSDGVRTNDKITIVTHDKKKLAVERLEGENICTDTDGGINYYEKGTVTVSSMPGTHNTDYCQIITNSPADYLNEEYCSESGGYAEELHICPDGCVDGACLIKPECKVKIPEEHIEITAEGKSGKGKYYLIKDGGVLNHGSGSRTYFVESSGSVAKTGGSCTVYLKEGASFNAGGSGSHTIYYEPGANIIKAGGSAKLEECPKIEFEYP